MKKNKGEQKVVSFKVTPDLYKQLEKYGSNQKDDTGSSLSPSQAARRLMLAALKSAK